MKSPDQTPTMKHAVDPVCQMLVNVDDKTIHIEHAAHSHYFCSEQCKADFEKDPKKYHS